MISNKKEKYKQLLMQSYKKLKSSVFFDKTQMILRDKIVEEEAAGNIEEAIILMADQMDKCEWDVINNSICNTITFLTCPKKLEDKSLDDKTGFITNITDEETKITEVQYFLDMKVEGYILGVAWLLAIGYEFDKNIYEHSYGNRLRKNLIDEQTKQPTYSPYLFEPYFQQYESWRDTAINYAKKSLNKNQDVIVITLDFKRFYYQVDISKDHLFKIIIDFEDEGFQPCPDYKDLIEPLTKFIWEVISTYSKRLREENYILVGQRNILPIGFHPSNVLANYCLKKFDEILINGWNPIYYGRYVDDIIIVDKIEKNSKIYRDAKKGNLTGQEAIDYFLLNCNAWKKSEFICENNKKNGLLIEVTDNTNTVITQDINNDGKHISKVYKINSFANEFSNSEIIVENSKVKVFYFNSAQSDALLTCFHKHLSENKSEFRFLPEDEAVFQNDDYTEIYNLEEKDGPNKLRGVEKITLDKYKLSKFLGKYMRISGLIDDKEEIHFDKDIEKIFTNSVIIENYITWEKVIQILVNNSKLNVIEKFVIKIIKTINKITYQGDASCDIEKMKITLLRVLKSSLSKSLAIAWGPEVNKTLISICQLIPKEIDGLILSWEYTPEKITDMRRKYCLTRMCDKYAVPILIDGFIDKKAKFTLNDQTQVNLTLLSDALKAGYNYKCLEENKYIYYPYLITMNDLAIYDILKRIYCSTKESDVEESDEESIENLKKVYTNLNYQVEVENREIKTLIQAYKFPPDNKHSMIKVGNNRRSIIKVAVANTRLWDIDFEGVLKGTPNRSYKRYYDVVKLVNDAIENKVNLLVMPESYLPFEWLPILARTCAKNQMALVTGIEHLKIKNAAKREVVSNLTAIVLPFREEEFKLCYVHFHSKLHFAPHERDSIESYRCEVKEGNHYELFNWDDFWFSVYCCYELTSIKDRAIFQSYADAIIMVEWNRDTNYYSNIVESLSRDLHCFCVQVNTAQYGDSRITQPSKTEEKDILKVKGGSNPVVLVDKINISELREFQLKGNKLQSKPSHSKKYKPTPPDFNYEVIHNKMLGTLWDWLIKIINK